MPGKGKEISEAEKAARKAQSEAAKAENRVRRNDRRKNLPKREKKPQSRVSKEATVRTMRSGTGQAKMPWSIATGRIPVRSLLAAEKTVSGRSSAPSLAYLRCLMNPELCATRIPDAKRVLSSLMYSKQSYVMRAAQGTSGDSRFSAAFQPIIGKSTGNMNTFKVAMVNPDIVPNFQTALPATWETFGTYTQSFGGHSYVTDQYQPEMTQARIANAQWKSGGTVSLANPLGTAPDPYVQNTIPAVFTLQVGAPSTIFIPAGVYQVSYEISLGTGLTGLSLTFNPPLIFGSIMNGPSISASATFATVRYAVTVGGNGTTMTPVATGGTVATASLAIETANYLNNGGYMNAGTIKQIRPVAMSVLYTSALPKLTDGGFVCGGCVPAATVDENYFQPAGNTDLGQFQFFENLENMKGLPRYPHSKGMYAYWYPENNNNLDFYTPEDSVLKNYPAIIISGQTQSSNAPNAVGIVGNVTVTCLWEFTTDSNLWPQDVTLGRQDIVDDALDMVAQIPTTFENPLHLKGVQDWMAKAADAVETTAAGAVPILKLAGALGSLIL